MSLYNQLFGVDPYAPALLAALKIDPRTVERIRDAFLFGGEIVVYTRTGGGNRESYAISNAALAAHPLYLRDEDDDYDSTYALFYFSYPEEYKEELTQLAAEVQTVLPKDKWATLLQEMQR